MNKFPLLLDTNIAIHLLKGTQSVVDFLHMWQTYVSFISEIELLGWSKLSTKEKKAVDELIIACTYLDYSYQLKIVTIEFIHDFQLKLPDAFIAATAFYYQLPLFTSDKVFKKIDKINLVEFNPVSHLIV